MSARKLAATFCCAVACLAAADRSETERAVVVYSAAPVPAAIRQEAASLMESAGYAVEWRDPATSRGIDANRLVVLEFLGDCAAPATPSVPAARIDSGRSLAAAVVQEGAVLPFARVDCAATHAILAPLMDREPLARRTALYARALGRLIAHELYHVLARTRDHASTGVAKPCFSAADLLSDRFEFEPATLDRLRRPTETYDVTSEAPSRQ